MRTCNNPKCGKGISHKRADAKVCDRSCKSAARHAAKGLPPRQPRGKCEVEPCLEVQKAKGVCSRHYQQLRRTTKDEVLSQPADAASCDSCGESLAGKRSNARFCNRTCKAAGFQTVNRVRLRGRDRARYPKEAMKRRADAKAYYNLNAEQRRAYAVQWRKENPHRRRHQHDRRVDLMLSNPGFVAFGEAEWRKLLRQYDRRCAYCGICSDTLEKDHVIPLTRGGRHAISNILPACKSCNISKYDHLLVEWRYSRREARAPRPQPAGCRL